MRPLLTLSLLTVGLCAACTPAPKPRDPLEGATGGAPPPSAAGSAVAEPTASPAEFAKAAVAAADRSEADRALDAGRHPAELLTFFNISRGQRVAELGAGGGYTSELLARVVGSRGAVFAQNSKWILERFAEKPWSERLKSPVLANVVRVDREFDEPLPPEAHDLDAVLIVLFYHDTVWLKVDRAKLNRAVFGALRPGGYYGIVDHSAKAGEGITAVETLHRIEESVVRKEAEAAGFVLDASSDVLRNPADTRDFNASPRGAGERRGTTDRFVLRFKKPGG